MAVKQRSLSVLAPLGESAQEVQNILTKIGLNASGQPTIPFRDSPSTHFARFAIIPDVPDIAGASGRLFFSATFDGNRDSYLHELCAACGDGLDQIFRYCKGYRKGTAKDPIAFAKYIGPYAPKTNLLFVSLPGLTVRTILDADGQVE